MTPDEALSHSAAKPGVNPWLVALVVSMATFMEVLDTSVANVSLGHIAGNLGAGQDESTWVLTSYLVANAIVIPISGWLSSVLGRKRFYMTCVALFTASSFLCGVAPSLGWLLVFRVLQGAGGGGLAPSEQSILADTFPPAQFGMAFAIYGIAVVAAPAIGPVLGGWITDNFSWRWIFLINIPVGVLSLIFTWRMVQDPPAAVAATRLARTQGRRVDYVGFALVVLAFGTLQLLLDKGQEEDWFQSDFIVAATAVAATALVGLVIWETCVVAHPIVDLPLMRNLNLTTSMVLQFVVGFILTSTTVLIPEFVQQQLGYDATNAGLVLMPGGVALMVMMPFAGRLVGRVQPKYLMAVGLTLTAGSMFYLTGIDATVDFTHLAWVRALQCIGLPLFFVPLNTIAYSNLPRGKNNEASAMMNLMRNLGGGVGISIATTLLYRREQFHQSRLSSAANLARPAFVARLNAHGGAGRAGLIGFYRELQQQAAMLSFVDLFQLFGIGCLVVVAMVLLLKKVRRGKAPVGMH